MKADIQVSIYLSNFTHSVNWHQLSKMWQYQELVGSCALQLQREIP